MGELIIGCHLHKHKTFYETVQMIGLNGLNTAQIFLGSPRTSELSPITEEDAKKTKNYIKKHDYPLFIHSSYIINLSKKGFSYITYKKELEESIKLGAEGCIVHQGKTVGLPRKEAIDNYRENIIKCINKVPNAGIILETAAGQGTELFYEIDKLAEFYKSFTPKQRKHITFCIDTCHIFAAGYDISTKKNALLFLKLWKKLIGFSKISCIHFNNSRDILGSRVDRHAPIDNGKIGIEGLKLIAKFAYQQKIPLILERGITIPYKEIELVRSWFK